jgi:hypothetical protein
VGLWRDSSGRLTFDLAGVEAADYATVCRGVMDAFGLAPVGDLLIGPDQMFCNLRRGDQVVGLDWDNWMQFMVVAQSEGSELLLQDIAAWLATSPWSGLDKRLTGSERRQALSEAVSGNRLLALLSGRGVR